MALLELQGMIPEPAPETGGSKHGSSFSALLCGHRASNLSLTLCSTH